ncbi:MAG: glycosyltransferase [Calditrichaeota bacterium]|nr:glycosyltransferase [Calditrichota bacterium]
MSHPELSVIIPTYNALSLLKRTIFSLEKQLPDPRFFQTVVVDDGSKDDTGDFLRGYSGILQLTSVINSENVGRAAVRNAGVKAANGRILLFIDGDMEFDSGLVAGHLIEQKKREIILIGKVVYKKTLPCRAYRRYIETRGANKLPVGSALPGRYFLSGHVSIPRNVFDAVGGFDENFKVHGGEDLDLGMRIVAAGYKIEYMPDLQMTHLHVRDLNSALKISKEYGHSSVPLLVAKHPDLIGELRLDWDRSSGLSGLFRRLLLSSIVYYPLKMIGNILNNLIAPAALYDYLIYRNYRSGYNQAISERSGK